MCADVVMDAVRDSGCAALLGAIDAIHAVHCASWAYDDMPARLAQRLGIDAQFGETSILAGTSGQRMVSSAAERMLRGECEVALVVGAEALATKKRLVIAGDGPQWSHPSPFGAEPVLDLAEWTSPTEFTHGVLAATLTFALLDSARRAALGVDPEVYRRRAADLFAPFTEVAAHSPHAWLPVRRSAHEIAAPTPTNRMVSSPYTKYMVAMMDVDMAASLIVTTHGKADELGIPRDQRVYLRGWSFGRDSTHLAERSDLHRSPAMRVVAADALQHAGISADDVGVFDLYSCFPAAVHFALDALGIDVADARPFTVTGGLPYHGGPSSNYMTHSIAEMVQRLRESGGYGVVSGVGLHMTKHSWGVYGSEPGPVAPPDYGAVQRRIDYDQSYAVLGQLDRHVDATIAACSATYDRSANPVSALVIADLGDRSRAYARTVDRETIRLLDSMEPVGLRIRLEPVTSGGHTFHVDERLTARSA